MAREAERWTNPTWKGKQEPGMFVYIPGEIIAQAFMGATCEYPDLSDEQVRCTIRVKRMPLQSNRRSAKIVLELAIDPNEERV